MIDNRLRESKLRLEHEHKMLRDEVAVLKMKTKAFALERARSLARVTEQKAELAKREELAIANDHRVAELERKIARMKGTMSPENRRVNYIQGIQVEVSLCQVQDTKAKVSWVKYNNCDINCITIRC